MSSRQISNPGGAFGQTATFDGQAIPLVAAVAFNGTSTAPVCVSLASTVGYVTTAATDAPTQAVGIVIDDCAAGDTVFVYTQGPVRSVPCNGTVNQFAILKPSATTAGYVAATATPVTGEALGIAMAASASNVVTMWVQKTLALS